MKSLEKNIKDKKTKMNFKILSASEIVKTLPKKPDMNVITKLMQNMWGERCVPLTKSMLHQIIDSEYSIDDNRIYIKTFNEHNLIYDLKNNIKTSIFDNYITNIRKHIIKGEIFIEYSRKQINNEILKKESEIYHDKNFDCFTSYSDFVFIFIKKKIK